MDDNQQRECADRHKPGHPAGLLARFGDRF
jgi:hypothetical protein